MTETDTTRPREWPEDVEAAVALLLSSLSEEDKATIASTPEAELTVFHHGWATGIRNDFGLWGGNRTLMESCIALGGGWADPDSASGVIIKAVWNHLNQLPLDHHQRALYETFRCELCGGQVIVTRWQEDEPTAAPGNPRCQECSWKTSPEYLQREEQTRRDNEVATIAFDKARRLGLLINKHYLVAKGNRSESMRSVAPSDDDLLLNVARDLYTTSEDFRGLWDEVKGESPGASHVAWLRLWKE